MLLSRMTVMLRPGGALSEPGPAPSIDSAGGNRGTGYEIQGRDFDLNGNDFKGNITCDYVGPQV